MDYRFSYSAAPLRQIKAVQFGVLSPDVIKSMSVAKNQTEGGVHVQAGIYRSETYDKDTGEPVPGGLNDLRMGTVFEPDHPGYFAHIELEYPVFHIGFMNIVVSLLRCVSYHTGRLLLPASDARIQEAQKKKGNRRLSAMLKILSGIKKDQDGSPQPRISKIGLKCFAKFETGKESETGDNKVQIRGKKAFEILERITDEDAILLGLDPKYCRPEWLILSVMPVPPPHVRPSVAMSATQRCEDDLTHKLSDIVKSNLAIGHCIKKGEPEVNLHQYVDQLQWHVATYFDNQIAGQPQAKQRSGKPLKTLRQRLVGKEGRVRGNLMGKRVDFSARTVITADPNLSIDQVGVPKSIALNLTVPERVTRFNIDKLRALVLVGADEHPGARYIVREDGSRIDLRYCRREDARITLKVGWIVERHLTHDDVVLFNRQPSLHKMSIMGHRVRVLDWSTFRLNLSVTSPYNADFDGDEMNLHVPQTLNARAEAETLMMTNKCIVSPQSNRPVMGIVQDSLLASCLMTRRDQFVTKDHMMNTVMWIDDWDGKIPIPAIMIPTRNRPGEYTPYWTGKQVFSLILPPVNIQLKANGAPDDEGVSDITPTDTFVHIENGRIISGTIDKKTLGTSGGSLVHVVFNEFGPERARMLLNQVQKVSNFWILHNGFTVGLGDTIADNNTLNTVARILGEANEKVATLVKKGQRGELEIQPGRTMQESFEDFVNICLNTARDDAGKRAEKSLGEENAFKCTVTAGSKGSFINISQIMACVGQQNVEGKRIPYGFRQRTLPHFAKDDLGPESRGFVENSYLKGLTPQEFFFHAMGGREGLIDTACKTAETGYIQRRLVKALEDVSVRYDRTVRNGQDHIIQFLYGEDGMDGASVETQSFDTLTKSEKAMQENYGYDVDHPDFGLHRRRPYMEPTIIEKVRGDNTIRETLRGEFEQLKKDQIALQRIAYTREPGGARVSESKFPIPVNIRRMIWNVQKEYKINFSKPSDLNPADVIEQVSALLKRLIVVPGADQFSVEAQENATLLFKILVRSTLASKQVLLVHRLSVKAFNQLLRLIESKFYQSLVNAGEMVGVLAAQSIGEPATQMTLNTFHYAGVSAKNVTLGVPRLKEIINIAKRVKTPSLTVYLDDEHSQDKSAAERVLSQLEYTTLADLAIETAILYDPVSPENKYTCLDIDRDFVKDFYELPDADLDISKLSPWVLRLELDQGIMEYKNISMTEIVSRIKEEFGADEIHIITSDENADHLVVRVRLWRDKSSSSKDESMTEIPNEDEGGGSYADEDIFLRTIETEMLYSMRLRGVMDIKKVFLREEKVQTWTPNGFTAKKKWVLDTEGTNLLEVLSLEGVDHKRTVSNEVVEIMQVLGIEAVRRSLLNELRAVISFDGSYVNYRHLAILVDCMTYRGYLMAITRHGINRAESGPLMRCSFEETVEILLEAAAFSQKDNVKGVSENIMLGQLAPLGTGSFQMLLDHDMVENAIIPEEDFDLDMTQGENGNMSVNLPFTPLPVSSPEENSMLAIQFPISPPSDGGVYGGNPTSGPQRGGGYAPSSPAYSPSSPAYSPSSPAYSPSSPAYSPSSPAYSPSSPAYSPSSPAYSPSSPAYSPSSPAYSPSSPAYSPSSPAYSPSSPAYSPSSPAYSPSSPAYSPSSPAYSPSSPAYSPSSPAYSPSSPAYSPSSPAYSPSSPAYSPSSPAYSPSSPAYSPSSPAYSPSSPAYEATTTEENSSKKKKN